MRKKLNIPREILYQKYIIEKKSIIDIGKEFRVSYQLIYNRLKEYNIPIIQSEIMRGKPSHKRLNIPKNILYKKYIVERKSTGKISKELNINQSTICGYLKEYNIKIRNRSESHKGINRGEKNYWYGKPLPKETTKKISETKIKLYKEGKIKIWNKGLTKYTDERIARIGRKLSETIKKFKDEDLRLYKLRQSKGGRRVMELNNKNSPYIWRGINFMSKEEMEVAKILLNKPILGVNCHIKIGNKTIDFFPQTYDKMFQGKFVEYHPWDKKRLTNEEYYNERRKALDNSRFKDKKLIVINNQKFIKENKKIKAF